MVQAWVWSTTPLPHSLPLHSQSWCWSCCLRYLHTGCKSYIVAFFCLRFHFILSIHDKDLIYLSTWLPFLILSIPFWGSIFPFGINFLLMEFLKYFLLCAFVGNKPRFCFSTLFWEDIVSEANFKVDSYLIFVIWICATIFLPVLFLMRNMLL